MKNKKIILIFILSLFLLPFSIYAEDDIIDDDPGDEYVVQFKAHGSSWADYCDTSSNYLSCKMVTASTPIADSSIDFSEFSSASNGRGLYYTTDTSMTEDYNGDGSGDVVYYYRGNVTNNYVRFDSYCWRIVRSTEDGNIRLIYGGTPNNQGNCPQTGTAASIGNSAFNSYNRYDNTYVGYMHGNRGQTSYANTHLNTTNSTIKTTVDNWYRNNLSDSASFIADYPFCNDRSLYSGNGYGTQASEYAPQHRFYGNENNNSPQTPTLVCAQNNDKFSVNTSNGNGALTYPIGLLTADEAAMAGLPYATSGNNTDSYLYSNANWWLMSPGDIYNQQVYAYEVANTGLMRLYTVTQSIGTRPVINLLSDATVSGGDGTYNNPYVVADLVVVNKYTVTYTDGVAGEDLFANQVYSDIPEGTDTPDFVGTPTRPGYVFTGWSPTVSATVTADVTYTAQWILEPKADLVISKQVTGNLAELAEEFSFKIKLVRNSVPINQSFDYYVGSTLQTTPLSFDASGEATVQISSLNDVTIKEIPVGTDYTIEEIDDNDYLPAVSTQSGTIAATDNVVTFVNNKERSPLTGIFTCQMPFYILIFISISGIIIIGYRNKSKKEYDV